MEKTSKTHILHLFNGGLRWQALRREGRRLALGESGEIAGEPLAALDQWADAHAAPGDAVRLYDGRPRYYSFALALPAAAARRQSGAVELKIRQELGVGTETVAWATRAQKRADGTGMLDLFTVVARREMLDPLAGWAARRQFGSFWVGADLDAIRCLVESHPAGQSVIVLNGEPDAAAVFQAESGGTVIKGRVPRQGTVNGSLPTDLVAGIEREGATRAGFGEQDWRWLAHQAPRIECLPENENLRGLASRLGTDGRLVIDSSRPLDLDAVIAGGVCDVIAKRTTPRWLSMAGAGSVTPMESLVAGEKAEPSAEWLEKLEAQLPARRRLTMYAVGGVAALILGIGVWLSVRASGRASLERELLAHRATEEIYRSQQGILTTVGGERLSVLPVLQAVHEAAPQGMSIASMTVGEDGVLRISVKTGERNHADAFLRALSDSPKLANVRIPEVRPEKDKFSFDASADIVDRKPRGRR